VVTLVEAPEMAELGVSDLPRAVKAAGMIWFHLPIPDLGVPDAYALEDWRAMSRRLHAMLEAGAKVLIHCRGGLGRAGTIAALLLIERGASAGQALRRVRAVRKGAIETNSQEAWLAGRSGQSSARARLVRASLLAGAMGDSLGADIEFLSLAQIRRHFPDGIADLPVHNRVRGAITDDTQMTLFSAEGVIRADVRAALKGICHPPSVVHHALLRWFRTQGYTPKTKIDTIGLMTDARLVARRAPGNTCLSSLMQATQFGKAANNDSKGCGAIMRVAPAGLSPERGQVRDLAVETSALTHGHPSGQFAAAAWAEMLADVALGGDLETSATSMVRVYGALDDGQETADAIAAALDAPRDGRAETVETLGEGWVAEEALAIALYCCLAADGLEQGLLMAVTHGGDSDSTGAIAGNMLGLLYPDQVDKHRWSRQVECVDLITRLAQDLCRNPEAEEAETLWPEYPGW